MESRCRTTLKTFWNRYIHTYNYYLNDNYLCKICVSTFIHYHSLVFSLRGRVGRNQSPVMWPVWLWSTATWASSWCSLPLFSPAFRRSHFAAKCLYVRNDARDPSSERWNRGRERCPVILPKFRLPLKFRDLLHAANLRHGTDGFTCPPKEGLLRIFSP